MIIGVGTDLINIQRIERAIACWGERFLTRLFTVEERQRAERIAADPSARAAAYAKRFAAKEACAKALGTGFTDGIFWRDLGVVSKGSGQLILHLTGQAAERLANITPLGMVARLDVTVSDEPPFAQALVIISVSSAQNGKVGGHLDRPLDMAG